MKHSFLPTIRLFLLVAAILTGMFLSFTKSKAQEFPALLKVEVAPVINIFWNENSQKPGFLNNISEEKFQIFEEKNNDYEATFTIVPTI